MTVTGDWYFPYQHVCVSRTMCPRLWVVSQSQCEWANPFSLLVVQALNVKFTRELSSLLC